MIIPVQDDNSSSDAVVVGAPVLDALFDLPASELLVECELYEFWDLVVGGEAQTDELIFAELVDTFLQGLGQQDGEADTFFEANDAVLDLERIGAHLPIDEKQCDGENNDPHAK